MNLIKVKCFKGLKVEVQDLGTQAATCPSNCPLKLSNKCSNDTFRYSAVLNPKVKVDIPYEEVREIKEEPVLKQEPIKVDLKETQVENQNDDYDPFGSLNDQESDSYDPFGEQSDDYNPFFSSSEVIEEVVKEDVQEESVLSKYNSAINNCSIFNGIEINKDQPCFKDGHLVFYETLRFDSAGNSRKALRHIFKHWYISKVFTRDGKSYTTEFLKLLKIRGFSANENELVEILNNRQWNLNQKFFRIFYNVIYKDEMTHFYWNDGDSIFVSIMPKFDDEDDLLRKLINDQTFFNSIKDCFEEVLIYLKTTKEEFFDKLPLIIANKERRVSFVSENKGIYKLVDLGYINSFAKDFYKINDLETLEQRFNFLSKFQITQNYNVLKRDHDLEIIKATEEEDDGIYSIVGINKFNTSQCATIYNLYTTLLKEYIDVFEPEIIHFGKFTISKNNFLLEIKEIIQNAYSWITANNKTPKEDDVLLLFTIKSFFSRGIFNYYESICESKEQLKELKDTFIKTNKLSLSKYFSYQGFKHNINTSNGMMTIEEYVLSILDQNFLKALPELNNDPFIKEWLNVVVDKAKETAKLAELKKLLK